MFENIKIAKVLILFLLAYSTGVTLFMASINFSGNSSEQINQLNEHIHILKIELEMEKKNNENLTAIKDKLEKELVRREEEQKRHEKSFDNLKPMFRDIKSLDLAPSNP